MGGWLSAQWGHVERYQTNLLVARSNGDNDTAANYYLASDSNHLASFGVVIRDWFFPGGHDISPDSVKIECLTWLMNQRTQPGLNDRSNAIARAAAWRTAVQAGQAANVLRECIASILDKPRTWECHYAQIVLDELQRDYAAFRKLDVSNLAGGNHAAGDHALDFFYYRALGAGLIGDQSIYLSSLKCTLGISNACGDRTNSFVTMMTNSGVPPLENLHAEYNSATGGTALTFTRESICLGYYPEGKNSLSAPWQPRTGTLTNQPGGLSTWLLPPEAKPACFFRLRAQPE